MINRCPTLRLIIVILFTRDKDLGKKGYLYSQEGSNA